MKRTVLLALSPLPSVWSVLFDWLELLVLGGVLALLVVPPLLRFVVFRKRPDKERCPICGSSMECGVCPRCGPPEIRTLGEVCPTCGSSLVDGECPNNHTAARCPNCGKIMLDGVCPMGCNARFLRLGWSGTEKPAASPWRLEVLEPAEFVGEACELPFVVVLGRSASEKKTTETCIQLHFDNRRKACECPCRYVKLVCDPATEEVTVELLAVSGSQAVVDGRMLSAPGDKAVLPEGGILDLQQTGYRLKLVRASAEESAR